MQGALDPDSGQEIEVAHELLLIALGLGQYRAQDGASTLFEQDFLFGETQLDLPHAEAQPTRDDRAEDVAPPSSATQSSGQEKATAPEPASVPVEAKSRTTP